MIIQLLLCRLQTEQKSNCTFIDHRFCCRKLVGPIAFAAQRYIAHPMSRLLLDDMRQ